MSLGDRKYGEADNALIGALSADNFVYFLQSINVMKADPNAVTLAGIPVACLLACRGADEATKWVLKAGGNPNIADPQGHTPVFYAILGGLTDRHVSIVKQYVAHPKYVPAVDKSGMTELEWAIRCCNSRLGALVYAHTPPGIRQSFKRTLGYQELMQRVERQR